MHNDRRPNCSEIYCITVQAVKLYLQYQRLEAFLKDHTDSADLYDKHFLKQKYVKYLVEAHCHTFTCHSSTCLYPQH